MTANQPRIEVKPKIVILARSDQPEQPKITIFRRSDQPRITIFSRTDGHPSDWRMP